MVRVLSAHHFASQDIQTCEDPVAVAAVPPDKLLIASADHVIEVRDLSKGGETVSTFPTVDLVQHMSYCQSGNYVATLEGAQVPGQGHTCVARVYSRWDGGPHGGQGPRELRARIAGCVTPSPASPGPDDMIDMIELRGGATALACCPATGNVLLVVNRMLMLYRFLVRTHESSRTRFIDFEDTEIRVSLSFLPVQTFLLEELVVCMGRHSLIVFRLWRGEPDSKKAVAEDASSAHTFPASHREPINLSRVLQIEQEVNSGRRTADADVPLPVTVQLPAIAAERASRGHCSPASGVVHHGNPFVADPADVSAYVFGSSAGHEDPERDSDFLVEVLLRLQLAADPRVEGGHGEQFSCMALQPLYRRGAWGAGPGAARKPESLLQSVHRGELCGAACMAATQQEGYLYHFALDGSAAGAHAHPCVAVYPFTAPVSRVVLEPLALHALTETGLETYTLRAAHRALAALQPACPPADDPICLIGLRPFLGMRHLLASGPHLVLLTSLEGSDAPPGAAPAQGPSPWTMYSLKLPTPEVLFSDMVAVGESHRVASPSTYCHLLGEAHCVLASARLLCDQPGAAAPPSPKAAADSEEALEAMYRESCAHLGDFHMLSDDAAERDLAVRYYRMAWLGPQRVLDRMRRHAQRLGQDKGAPATDADAQLRRGQIHYLEAEVLEPRQLDDQGARQLTSQLLDFLETDVEPTHLASQVLRARLLREYAATRTLSILRARQPPPHREATVVLALLVLEVQVGGVSTASEVLSALRGLASDELLPELLRHWELLVDGPGLSELATVLMEQRPADVADLLARLVAAGTVPLARILKMMLDHLSTRIGSSGSSGSVVSAVFQRFLEAFFAAFFASAPAGSPLAHMDLATEEALKILVRSYLSDLQSGAPGPPGPALSSPGAAVLEPRSQPRVLLEEDRLPFLDCMPPFAADLSELLASPTSPPSPASPTRPRSPAPGATDAKRLSLRKLQAVLCSGRPTRACVTEVLFFVRTQPGLFGNLSLQVLCLPPREASALLLDFCPQAVLRYAQDFFRNEEDWRHLLTGLESKLKTFEESQSGQPRAALGTLYRQTLADVLAHLSRSVDLATLCRLLRLEASLDETLDPASTPHLQHLLTCQRVASANAVRDYIASTSAACLSQLDH